MACFEAGVLFARAEGSAATILFNLCGHGNFFAGKRTDQRCSEEALAMALSGLPAVPA